MKTQLNVFGNGPENQDSILGQVIPKTQKMVIDVALLKTLSIIKYRTRVKWSNPGKGVATSPTSQCSGIEKRAFGLPLTTVANFTYLYTRMTT